MAQNSDFGKFGSLRELRWFSAQQHCFNPRDSFPLSSCCHSPQTVALQSVTEEHWSEDVSLIPVQLPLGDKLLCCSELQFAVLSDGLNAPQLLHKSCTANVVGYLSAAPWNLGILKP